MTEQKQEKKLGKRTPLYAQKKVGIKERPGYERRLVNETAGRVDRFKAAGWDFVQGDNESTSDNRLQKDEKYGNKVRPLVNTRRDAPCTHAVWMEIPIEYYNEDQAAKMADWDKTMETLDPRLLKERHPEMFYGGMQMKKQ